MSTHPDSNKPVVLWPDQLLSGGEDPETIDESGIVRSVSTAQIIPLLPPADKANQTGVIICPGGGYALLDWTRHVKRVAEHLNDKGIAVIGLRYRTAPPSTNVPRDALEDLRRAVRVTCSMQSSWNIRPDRLAGLGFSAGANLLLHLATTNDEREDKDSLHKGRAELAYLALICLWPFSKSAEEYAIGPGFPNTFLCASKEDQTAPAAFSQAIAANISKAGSDAELKLFETGGHLSFNLNEDGLENNWIPDFLTWLESSELL